MSGIAPETRDLARQILRQEAGGPEPAALAAALTRLHSLLRRRLVALIGSAGFAALFARALHLARAEYPALDAVAFDTREAFDTGGAADLHGIGAFATARPPDEVGEALAAILAQFIGLLTTFVGDDLGLRLIDEARSAPGQTAAGINTETHE